MAEVVCPSDCILGFCLVEEEHAIQHALPGTVPHTLLKHTRGHAWASFLCPMHSWTLTILLEALQEVLKPLHSNSVEKKEHPRRQEHTGLP